MKKCSFLITIILVFGLFENNYADRRYFGYVYLANTLPANSMEFELWNTAKIGKYEGYYYRFQPQLEFEYGVTDRLSASLYMDFNQVNTSQNKFQPKSLEFSGSAIELRYRFTNPGESFVDPGLYFEFKYGGDELEYESKVLFSRRFGNFVSGINFTSEIERKIVDGEHESKFEVSAGLAYEFSPVISFGVEISNQRNYENIYRREENNATYIGPTINFQSEKCYLTFNYSAQVVGSPVSNNNLNLNGHEKYTFRTILGIEI